MSRIDYYLLQVNRKTNIKKRKKRNKMHIISKPVSLSVTMTSNYLDIPGIFSFSSDHNEKGN